MKNFDTASLQKIALNFLRQGKLSKSLKTIDKTIKPGKTEALSHFIKGRILQESNKYKASILSYTKYISLEKKEPKSQFFRKAKFYLALNYLTLRRFDDALQFYKFRHTEETLYKYKVLPKWDISVEEGDILIWAEQGIGDEIFFSRFLPFLQKNSGTFYLECDKRLHEIIKVNNPHLKLLDRSVEQNLKNFDYQIAFGDLFSVFKEHINNLNTPYIKVSIRPEINMMREIYKGKYLVGISWRTLSQEPEQKKSRNVDLGRLCKSLDPDNTMLIILQPLALESEKKLLVNMGFNLVDKFDATNDVLAVFELISIFS